MPWLDRAFNLPRITLHARQLDAGGPWLVLLHGLSADGSVWQGVGRRLSPPFTLLAPDLRGHGLSDHPKTGYSAGDYAQDIAELIDALTANGSVPAGGAPLQVDLLGHSLGAIAALGAAALRPASVRRLVLVDPPLEGPRTLPGFLQRMLEARHLGDEAAIQALIIEQTPGLSETLLHAYERIWSRVADGALEAVVSERDRAFVAVTDWYPRVQSPTLILRADERLDAACSAHAAARAFSALPNARSVTIEGASHNIHAAKPVEFARHIIEFLHEASSSPVRGGAAE